MDLRSEVSNDEWVRQVMTDWRQAELDEADRVLLEFTVKLTRCPTEMGQADVDGLRAVGFDDRAIHDATQVVALFAYYNRVAEGLGVTWDGESERESPPEPGPEPRGEIG